MGFSINPDYVTGNGRFHPNYLPLDHISAEAPSLSHRTSKLSAVEGFQGCAEDLAQLQGIIKKIKGRIFLYDLP
ncbi:hypothetical protein SFA71_14195 [Legionella pneumophila subsp. fraseri]|nr:hypothetical protein [Legionella pneumophila]MDW8963325.1 hypothetical protein [Legionella pneumophila subsp. fraseri]MDW9064789.1 hypothetical protein [Legionella pneumophila subsp. fraseri]HAT1772083.1 hypothetical protein [Legionella pneumophila]HAT1845767.1 hypothetical protein [Legionella pneumophila]HAT2145467.1 hypothetical protein [Legionella pneumophila]